jgi:hypothetical protein
MRYIQPLFITLQRRTNSGEVAAGAVATDDGLGTTTGVKGGATDDLTLGVGVPRVRGDAGLAVAAAPDALV